MSITEPQRLRLLRRSYAFVLAGGRGSRLKQLTDVRCKPAVYFGGKFRIIDFVLSNCLNSGIRRIGVLTQYKSHSLLRHLQRGWAFLKSEMNEFLDLMPAQQRVDERSWYKGTADAVYQNLDIVSGYGADYILVLAGDHIYKMDYMEMLARHVASGAACTVGCIEVPVEDATGFGVMDVDASGLISRFIEKPPQPPSMPGKPGIALASMGIYVFNAQYLYDMLEEDAASEHSEHDFGRNLIPAVVARGDARALSFDTCCVGLEPGREPYWRDVGTIDAYWEANIDLTATVPALNMYDNSWPIWTYQEQLPPAKFVHNWQNRRGTALESLVSGGCIISGELNKSLLFSKCRVHSYASVDSSVLLPEVEVGRGVRLHRCVIDHGCKIPDGMIIGENPELDAARFNVTERGITLVTRDMLAKLGMA
ncbi:MAG: glucose-1-phosphate adenylyltransferase [Gammaproteobacteria bacterium]|nr:glucose-1-phosphate adenylyltransferase [Gammaproteobacteria bacterium]